MPKNDMQEVLTDLRVKLYQHVGGGTGIPTAILPHPNMHINSVYTITNGTIDRTYDADTVAVAELADIVYSLITDLKTLGLIS